jgi:hypothetical protein
MWDICAVKDRIRRGREDIDICDMGVLEIFRSPVGRFHIDLND